MDQLLGNQESSSAWFDVSVGKQQLPEQRREELQVVGEVLLLVLEHQREVQLTAQALG